MSILQSKSLLDNWLGRLIRRRIPRSRKNILENITFIRLPDPPSSRLIAPSRMLDILIEAKQNGDLLLIQTIEDAWVKTCRMLDNKSYFDICPVDVIMNTCSVRRNADTEAIYRNLNVLHCKDYGKMNKELINMLPDYLNAVFSEGNIPVRK